MNPILSIVLQLSVALTLAISVASAEEPPVLSVFVSSPQGIEPYLRGAPMRLLVHISNTSLQPASVLVNNGSDYFTCECVMKDGQPLKAVPPDAVREKPDTTDIAAGKSMVRSVYLNNYYTFASDGEFQTTWKVNIPLLLLGKLQSYATSGIHGSKIATVSDDRTREEIGGYYSFFQNANNELIKIDMLMGIASVRTAIGLSYLERCLSSDRYGNLAAFHLANRWANDKSGREVMDRFLATSINPHALQLIIDACIRERHLLPDDVVQRLLKSTETPIYECGVQYVQKTVARLRLDLVRDGASANDVRRDIAKPLFRYLREALTKDGKSPLVNDTGTKGDNGF